MNGLAIHSARRSAMTIWLAAMLVSAVAAADPPAPMPALSIDGPVHSVIGQACEYRVVGAEPALWIVDPDNENFKVYENQTVANFSCPAEGTWRIRALIVTQTTPVIKLRSLTLTLVVGKPVPPVPPVPPNPPTPTPTKLTIAIVENPKTSTVEQRQVLADKTWRDAATAKHDFRGIIPTDIKEASTGKPPVSLQPFLTQAAKQSGVSVWVMFCDAGGTIVWEGPLPATAVALKELITKYGG